MAVREGMTCVPYKGRGTFVVAAGRVATCKVYPVHALQLGSTVT